MDAHVVLKVVSAIAGPNINDHIHPHDPLAARPISRPSKKRVCRKPRLRDLFTKTIDRNSATNHSKPK